MVRWEDFEERRVNYRNELIKSQVVKQSNSELRVTGMTAEILRDFSRIKQGKRHQGN